MEISATFHCLPTRHALTGWARAHRNVYCYFDNDQLGYPAHDAARLQNMIEQLANSPRSA